MCARVAAIRLLHTVGLFADLQIEGNAKTAATPTNVVLVYLVLAQNLLAQLNSHGHVESLHL